MSRRYFITAGHGGGDPGAVANGFREADLVRELRDMIVERLQLLGKADRVAMVWGFAVALFALTIASGFVLPEEVPAMPFAIAQLVGMVMLAKYLTEADIQHHEQAGGAFLSNWRAAGIAVLFSIGVMALIFAVLMITGF